MRNNSSNGSSRRGYARFLATGLVQTRLGLSILSVFVAASPSEARQSSAPETPAVEVAPRRVPEGLNFANGLFRQRRFELAAEEYERFLDTKPSAADTIDAQFGLANARLFQRRYQEAQNAFKEFLELAPDHPRAQSAWYRLGELGYLLGDLQDSRRALEKFRDGNPSHPNFETAWTYLGDVCYALKDPNAAKEAYEKGLAAFPKGSLTDRTKYGLGRTLVDLDRKTEARKIFEELARTGNRDWTDRAWLQLGKVYLSEKDYQKAITAFETLRKESPTSQLRAESQVKSAEARLSLKQPKEAKELLKPVAEDSAQALGPQAVLMLATIELEEGRSTEAVEILKSALNRFPNSPLLPSLSFRLAEALERAKLSADASARYLQLVREAPKDPLAETALSRAIALAGESRDYPTIQKLSDQFETTYPSSVSLGEVRLAKARAMIAERKSKDAIPILESVLGESFIQGTAKDSVSKLDPKSCRAALYELALAYRESEQRNKADSLFRKLAEESDKNEDAAIPKSGDAIGADARFLVGQTELEAGQYAKAIAPLESYLKSEPKGELADLALSHLIAAQTGLAQLEQAEQRLTQLEEQFPKSQNLASSKLRLAEAMLQGKKYPSSERLYRELAAIKDSKQRFRIQLGLAETLWNLNKPREAAQAYSDAIEANPNDPSVPEIALAKARALDISNQSEQALSAYSDFVDRYPKSDRLASANIARARLMTKLGRPLEAAKLYEQLLADPTRSNVAKAEGITDDQLLADWGWCLVDGGKTWDADRVFGRLLKEFANSPLAADARLNLAESMNSAHNHKEVIQLLRPLTEPDAKVADRLLPSVLYRLGRAYIETSDWRAAAPVLDRLISKFPDSPLRREAMLFRAEVALQTAEPATARDLLAKLLSETSGDNDSHSQQFKRLVHKRMIQSLMNLNEWDDVLKQTETLQATLGKDDPASAELAYARGRALQGLARLDEARSAYQSVIEFQKGTGELAAQARFMRGESYFHENKLGEARREFLMVDTLHKDAPKWRAAALLEAGKVYEKLARWEEAVHYYRALLEDFPEDPRAKDAKQRLDLAQKQGKDAGQIK